jgi:hypothetical protein
VRMWIEKLVRGGKKNTEELEKRLNKYSWCYADDRVFVAQGSSGSVALWIRASTEKSIDNYSQGTKMTSSTEKVLMKP